MTTECVPNSRGMADKNVCSTECLPHLMICPAQCCLHSRQDRFHQVDRTDWPRADERLASGKVGRRARDHRRPANAVETWAFPGGNWVW